MEEKDCSYEEMTKSVGGQSMPSEYYSDEPDVNKYEKSRKGYNANGLDQSGMKKGK